MIIIRRESSSHWYSASGEPCQAHAAKARRDRETRALRHVGQQMSDMAKNIEAMGFAFASGSQRSMSAVIALIRPDRTGKPMAPSGKFKRVKDREPGNGASDAEYRRTEQADDPGEPADWRHTKVHVGRRQAPHRGPRSRAEGTRCRSRAPASCRRR